MMDQHYLQQQYSITLDLANTVVQSHSTLQNVNALGEMQSAQAKECYFFINEHCFEEVLFKMIGERISKQYLLDLKLFFLTVV